jgi:hypothetical protein
VDGTDLPYVEEDGDQTPPTDWDNDQTGLVVERGDGFVTLTMPTSPDSRWGIAGVITFDGATITSVQGYDCSGPVPLSTGTPCPEYSLESGNDGSTGWQTTADNDEVDFHGDTYLFDSEPAPNAVAFWLATTTGRDGFRVNLSYDEPTAAMTITRVDSYGVDDNWYAVGSEQHEYDAAVPLLSCSPPPARINIRADIDGRSRLIIQDNTVQWQHFDWDAPGRENGTNFPTYINGDPWFPDWPDIPNPENQDCDGCLSSILTPYPPLPSMENFIGIEEVGDGCRHNCEVVELPTSSNGYKLVIEFDDNPVGGSTWYEIDVLVGVGGQGTTNGLANAAASAAVAGTTSAGRQGSDPLAAALALGAMGPVLAAIPIGWLRRRRD